MTGPESTASSLFTQKLMQFFGMAMLATCVTAIGLTVYDRQVRVPQTPRIAVVDVTALYASAQRTAARSAMLLVDRSKGEQLTDDVASAALGQVERTAADFGPRLNRSLSELADECHCVVVAMAAVHGSDSGIPNYTKLLATRLGLEVGS